ncbi:MAG: PKD domain-containing protein [Planctomycetota bacterium]
MTIAFVALFSGCSQLVDSQVPEQVHSLREPEFGAEYLLYRPSNYRREQSWPLLVACPAGGLDSPKSLMRDWSRLAEDHGFVVVAPLLERASRGWRKDVDEQTSTLESDERRILSVVRHVCAGHTISEDRVLIHGWATGATTTLFAGLRNPEVFRAVAVTRPQLPDDRVPGPRLSADPYQPVFVHYRAADVLTGKPGRACADWLRTLGVDVREERIGRASREDFVQSVQFFEHLLRTEPWVVAGSSTPDPKKPLERSFKVKSSFPPSRYHWQFGDGDESPVAEPLHVYKASGAYRVLVNVHSPAGKEVTRAITVTVGG